MPSVLLVLRVSLAHKARQARRVLQDHKVLLVRRVLTAPQAPLVRKVRLARRVRQAMMERLVRRDLRARKALRELRFSPTSGRALPLHPTGERAQTARRGSCWMQVPWSR